MRTVLTSHGGGRTEKVFVSIDVARHRSRHPRFHGRFNFVCTRPSSFSSWPKGRVRLFLFCDMEGHHKRKRDYEGTVVTFYTPDTTFRRVFKGAFSGAAMVGACECSSANIVTDIHRSIS